jgi:hypothetical protein
MRITHYHSVLLGLGVFGLSGVANAATYQVGPGKTYANLAAVAPVLAAGDVVEVTGDTTYSSVRFEKAGSQDKKITIRGIRVNGKRPVLSGGANTVEFAGNHYVMEGFDITGGSSRCVFHHAHDITLRDSVVHNCPGHGILGADSDSGSLTLDYVEVYSAGSGDTRHPIYIATDESAYPGSVFRMQHCYVHDGNGGNNVKTRAERNEIYYNWIEGAMYHELELIGPDGQDAGLAREDSDVVGNVFRKTKQTYVTRVGGDGTGDTSGRYRFVNNTFLLAQGSSAAFRVFDGIQSIEMHNNVFYRVGGGGVQIMNTSNASWSTGSAIVAGSRNWVAQGSSTVPASWTGTITGTDPGFVDLGALDLRPSEGSALLDVGTMVTASAPGYAFPSPLALPTMLPPRGALEPVGSASARPVVGGIDLGAFEAGSGSGGSGGSGGAGGGTTTTTSDGGGGSGGSATTSTGGVGGAGGSATTSTGGAGGAGGSATTSTGGAGGAGGSATTSTGGAGGAGGSATATTSTSGTGGQETGAGGSAGARPKSDANADDPGDEGACSMSSGHSNRSGSTGGAMLLGAAIIAVARLRRRVSDLARS